MKQNKKKLTRTQHNQIIDTLSRAFDTIYNIADRDITNSRRDIFNAIKEKVLEAIEIVYKNSNF